MHIKFSPIIMMGLITRVMFTSSNQFKVF